MTDDEVTVTREGVRFGPYCWIAHEAISPAEQARLGSIVAVQYRAWVNARLGGQEVITVNVLINGQPIFTRSAARIEGEPGEVCVYRVDDCITLRHHYNDGALVLAHKLLDCITEPKR